MALSSRSILDEVVKIALNSERSGEKYSKINKNKNKNTEILNNTKKIENKN
jgi:hypothetical protein